MFLIHKGRKPLATLLGFELKFLGACVVDNLAKWILNFASLILDHKIV